MRAGEFLTWVVNSVYYSLSSAQIATIVMAVQVRDELWRENLVLKECYIRHFVPMWQNDGKSMEIDPPEISISSY